MSSWNTPSITPMATPVAIAEPISIVLQKHIDVSEKVRQVFSSITSGSRVLSDTSAVVEQLPALLLLLKDASAGRLSVDAAEQLYALFSIHSPNSITRLLTTKETTFVFPLSSLPSTMDWTKDFEFFKFLGYSKRNLIDMRAKTITLDAIDYFFFVIAVLGITDTNQQLSPWGASAGQQTSQWYNAGAQGSVHSRVLLEILETAMTSGKTSSSMVSPVIAHKCDLSLAAFEDFFCGLSMYSFSNAMVDFGSVFDLVKSVFGIAIKSSGLETRTSHPSASAACVSRITKLLTEVMDVNNFFAQKFLHKMTPNVFRSLAALFKAACLPWDFVAGTVVTTTKDTWIKRHADIYALFVEVLTSPRVVEFVAEYKAHSTEPRFSRFIALSDTKHLIEATIDVVSIVAPATGIVEALPNVFLSTTSVAVVRSLWSVCRACAWVNNKAPKNLTDVSWHMDQIVQSAKGCETNEIYKIFTWDVPSGQEPELIGTDVPKRLTHAIRELTNGVSKSLVSWDQPVCASESKLMICWLQALITAVTHHDLRKKPTVHAWVRSFASYSSLTVIAFSIWMTVSLSVCPSMQSGARIAVIQFLFVVVVGLLAVKWITSQYIV